jgi:hypothetical protein
MNKRIKKLAKQAYEDVIKNTPSFLVTKELYEQKFAELIVQECVQICEQGTATQTTSSGAASMIKQHFGVE